jgi:hypothetical protein
MLSPLWKLMLAGVVGMVAAPMSAQASSFYAVGNGGLCIDVTKGIAEPGTPIILWHCHGKGPQLFTIDTARAKIRYRAARHLCIDDIPNHGLALVDCNKTRINWSYNPATYRIEGSDGRCWDIPNAKYAPLKRLIIWKCHNGENQKFVFN